MLLAPPAASASAAVTPVTATARTVSATVRVRFLQATPGQPPAVLNVVSGGLTTSAGGRAAFGELTPYASAPAGLARLEIRADGKTTHSSATLAPGARYTVVASGTDGRSRLRVYRDGDAMPGMARLRVIHAAPELGGPDIRLGGRAIAQALRFGEDTGYIDLTPGTYTDEVVAPGGRIPIVARRVVLQAGTATTTFLTGTAGAKESIVVGTDQTITPGGPPQTGLGGLATDGGAPWPLVALIALCGALLTTAFARAGSRRGGA